MSTELLKLIGALIESAKLIKRFGKKIWYLFIPLRLDIAVSIQSTEGLNSGSYYKHLIKVFQTQLQKYDLQNIIVIKQFADIKRFKTNEEAINFVKKKKIALLIWGDFSVDNLKEEGKVVNEVEVNLTFLHGMDRRNIIGNALNLDIASKMDIQDHLKIYEDNSFPQVSQLSEKLFDIASYTFALVLKSFGDFTASNEVLESLLNQTKNQMLMDGIRNHLINNYQLLSEYEGRIRLDFGKAAMFCEKILALDEANVLALNNLAICKFKSGDVDSASRIVENAYLIRKHNPLCMLNRAFISILQNDYKKASRMYKQIRDAKVLNFEVLEAIEFLHEQYRKRKDPALLFGSAILNIAFKDKNLGLKDLKKFMRRADETRHSDMLTEARKLLSEK